MVNAKNFTFLVTLFAVFAGGVAHGASATEQAAKYEEMKLNYYSLYGKLQERSPENQGLMSSPQELADHVESVCASRGDQVASCRVKTLGEIGHNLRDQLDSAEILNIREDQGLWTD